MIKQKYDFKLPMPPSINHAYIHTRGGGKVLNAEAKDFIEQTKIIIKSLGLPKVTGCIKITAVLYFNHFTKAGKKSEQSVDGDNRLKILYDALKAEYEKSPKGKRVPKSQRKLLDGVEYIFLDDDVVFNGTYIKHELADIEPHVHVFAEEIDKPIMPDNAYDIPDYLRKALDNIKNKKEIRGKKKKDKKEKMLNLEKSEKLLNKIKGKNV